MLLGDVVDLSSDDPARLVLHPRLQHAPQRSIVAREQIDVDLLAVGAYSRVLPVRGALRDAEGAGLPPEHDL